MAGIGLSGRRHPRKLLSAIVAVVVVSVGISPAETPAELLVKGTGVHRTLPRQQFGTAPVVQKRYDLFVARCTRCHRMARVIDALQLGVTPVTRSRFDEQAIPKYVVKMLRKGSSGIGKTDAREIIEFILMARRLALVPGPRPTTPAPTPAPPAPAAASADAGLAAGVPAPDAGVPEAPRP